MKIPYHNFKLRLYAALISSIYMVLHGRFSEFFRAIKSPAFYFALIVSFTIAYFLITYIHYITIRLDSKCGWRQMPAERSVLQFTLGVLLPALLDLLIVHLYFGAKGENIIDNGFLLIDFPVIFCLLFLFNTYYLIMYLLLTENKTQADQNAHSDSIYNKSIIEASRPVHETIEFSYRGRQVKILISEVLYFYRYHNQVRLVAKDGKAYSIKTSLAGLSDTYRNQNFCQVNRSVVINLDLLDSYSLGERRDTLELVVKPGYQPFTNHVGVGNFQVTKEHITTFLEEFRKFRQSYPLPE